MTDNAGDTAVHHPLFARWYRLVAGAAERKGAAEHRRRLLEGATGRVIEIGAGHGLNFSHYPETVTEVVAVEPEPYLRDRASEAARVAPVPIRVVDGTADCLPVEDASFDVGVLSLVMCSVPDQAAALDELRRVIRSGGELRFYEHVVADSPRWAKRQRRAAGLWSRLAGGCRPDRDTAGAIRDAGFTIERLDYFLFAPALVEKLVAPHILGTARRG